MFVRFMFLRVYFLYHNECAFIINDMVFFPVDKNNEQFYRLKNTKNTHSLSHTHTKKILFMCRYDYNISRKALFLLNSKISIQHSISNSASEERNYAIIHSARVSSQITSCSDFFLLLLLLVTRMIAGANHCFSFPVKIWFSSHRKLLLKNPFRRL